MMGAKTLDAKIADGTAKVEGDASILKRLASTMAIDKPQLRGHYSDAHRGLRCALSYARGRLAQLTDQALGRRKPRPLICWLRIA